MFNIKIISILAIIVFLLIGCENSEKLVAVENSDLDLGHQTANIQDYFYDFDDNINAKYLYNNLYSTGSANTFTSFNPYEDTLNFSTFSSYIVEIEDQPDTIGYQLALTADNIDQYATLYPLNELNTSENNWCNNILVQYERDCPNSIEVDFDYSISLSSTTGKEIDTVISQAVFQDIVSKKSADFEVAWTNTISIFWDSNNERYDIITPDSSESMSATLIDSTTDTFDSLIYVGVIDTNRYSIEGGLMFIDRTEWERHDIEYKSSEKSITLDTTFVYNHVRVPDDSPMYQTNGDCNQNLIWDQAEEYYDFGLDWCPDSLENGDGQCVVVDSDYDGELFDEEPCNCLGNWLISSVNNPEYIEGSDPNGDNWNDCGLDGKCPGHPADTNGNENGTELNSKWDRGEGYEKNNQYDFDDLFGGVVKPSEYYVDKGNGVIDTAEFCVEGEDSECNGLDPFEDRNCNEKWDAAETVDAGNGIWDKDEGYIDTSENGLWDSDEPLYVYSDRLETFIVNYADPENPIAVNNLDISTSAVLYYGTEDNAIYETTNNFLKNEQITVKRSKGFYDIDSLVTIYTNKIIEHSLSGISGDYHLAKTKWPQDFLGTAFDENEISKPYYGEDYGYDYHLFQIGGNGDIYKIVHPAYFKYYGYYTKFADLDLGFWKTEMTEKEVYIHTDNGLLRDGEYIYSDTTIVTPFADYYIEKFYEVEYDTISIKMKKINYLDLGGSNFACIAEVEPSWISEYDIDPPDNCPPADTTLNNTYKITNTKLITMIGSGLEFGLRNTIWLGSAGTLDPLGIVKDQLEIRWSEPYWEEYGSEWNIISRLELTSLQKNNDGASRMLNIFDLKSKRLSLNQIRGNEFDNDPYKYSPVFGLHRLWIPDEK